MPGATIVKTHMYRHTKENTHMHAHRHTHTHVYNKHIDTYIDTHTHVYNKLDLAIKSLTFHHCFRYNNQNQARSWIFITGERLKQCGD